MQTLSFPRLPSVLIATVFALSANAASITWTGDADDGGNFLTAGNWDSSVPGAADTAVFNQTGVVTVFFPTAVGTYSIDGINFVQASAGQSRTLDIDLGGRTLASATALPTLNTIISGTETPSQTLIFRDGAVTAPTWTISNDSFNNSIRWSMVQLDNADVNLGSGTFTIGYWNRADLHVENGSSVTTTGSVSIGTLNAGTGFGGKGNVFIDGATSTFNAARTTVGQRGGVGTLTVTNGGTFTSSENLQLGRRWDNSTSRMADGTVTIDGTGSTATAVNFFVGGGAGGAVTGDGTGTGIFNNGGDGSFTSMRIFYTDAEDIITRGTLVIDGGKVTVAENALFEQGAIFRVGLDSPLQDVSLLVEGNLTLNTANSRGTTDISGTFLELLLAEAFNPQVNDTFLIAEYAGSLTGNFLWGTDSENYTTLLEDSTFSTDDHTFRINYAVDTIDGSAIALTVIPEPSAAAAIGTLILILTLLRRRRK